MTLNCIHVILILSILIMVRNGNGNGLIMVHKLEATDKESFTHLYDGTQSQVLSIDAVCESEELCKLEQCLFKFKALLCEK